MTFTILVWNFNTKKGDETRQLRTTADYARVVADIAADQAADLIVLLECSISENTLLQALRARDASFEISFSPQQRFKCFARFARGRFALVKSDPRVIVGRLDYDPTQYADVLLASVHGAGGFHVSRDRQWMMVKVVRDVVEASEREAGHTRTLMSAISILNPYDKGMIDSDRGFGAMMNWELAEAHARDGTARWYNPMWRIMGGPASPGTYYWLDDEPANPYWNCIDGVLVRPTLRAQFLEDESNPEIINSYRKEDGEEIALIRLAKRHHRIAYSDHLPLVFRFALPDRFEAAKEIAHA